MIISEMHDDAVSISDLGCKKSIEEIDIIDFN